MVQCNCLCIFGGYTCDLLFHLLLRALPHTTCACDWLTAVPVLIVLFDSLWSSRRWGIVTWFPVAGGHLRFLGHRGLRMFSTIFQGFCQLTACFPLEKAVHLKSHVRVTGKVWVLQHCQHKGVIILWDGWSIVTARGSGTTGCYWWHCHWNIFFCHWNFLITVGNFFRGIITDINSRACRFCAPFFVPLFPFFVPVGHQPCIQILHLVAFPLSPRQQQVGGRTFDLNMEDVGHISIVYIFTYEATKEVKICEDRQCKCGFNCSIYTCISFKRPWRVENPQHNPLWSWFPWHLLFPQLPGVVF